MVLSEAAVAAAPEVVHVRVGAAGPLTPELVDLLDDACERARSGSSVVVHLTGTSTRPAPWPGPVTLHLVTRWERVLRRIERLPAFTVCVLEGGANHGALEILLATDHRLVMPGSTVELDDRTDRPWPGTALHRLVQQIGLAKARRIMTLPHGLTATALVSSGIVDDLTADVDEPIIQVARRAADVGGAEVAVRRQLLLDAVTLDYEDALGVHLAACDRTLRRSRPPDGTP